MTNDEPRITNLIDGGAVERLKAVIDKAKKNVYQSVIELKISDATAILAMLESKQGMGWTNEKPTESGLYFRSNPALQNDITRQDVYMVGSDLYTVHPMNTEAVPTLISAMPKGFLWLKIPHPKANKLNDSTGEK